MFWTPASYTEMRNELEYFKRDVKHSSANFQKEHEYAEFIKDI